MKKTFITLLYILILSNNSFSEEKKDIKRFDPKNFSQISTMKDIENNVSKKIELYITHVTELENGEMLAHLNHFTNPTIKFKTDNVKKFKEAYGITLIKPKNCYPYCGIDKTFYVRPISGKIIKTNDGYELVNPRIKNRTRNFEKEDKESFQTE
jgi:hypothetical protein